MSDAEEGEIPSDAAEPAGAQGGGVIQAETNPAMMHTQAGAEGQPTPANTGQAVEHEPMLPKIYEDNVDPVLLAAYRSATRGCKVNVRQAIDKMMLDGLYVAATNEMIK